VYAIESIKNKGVAMGVLLAFDRLSRCNASLPKNYPIDKASRKYLDPAIILHTPTNRDFENRP